MADYSAHVFVCTNSEGAEDKRHCGDKGGGAVRKRFNELLAKHDLIGKVTISRVGCTSQHGRCEADQATVIVYGPDQATGGTWYTASPNDVEEIIAEHLVNRRIVPRLHNPKRAVRFA